MVMLSDELAVRCKCGRYRPACVCERQQSAKERMTARLWRELNMQSVAGRAIEWRRVWRES